MISSTVLLPVLYKDQKRQLKGLITPNYESALPGVLILPAWMGIDREAKAAAGYLQSHGYIALIADIYGEDQQPRSIEEAAVVSKAFKENYRLYQHRISLALQELKRVGVSADQVVVMGYCFGGTGALEAVRGQLEIQAAICVHGSLYKSPSRNTVISNSKFLIEHAADDQFISQKDVESLILEMKESKADWQLITYGNAKHTFTNPWSEDYNKAMANRAWKHTLQFLDEVLK